jgi:HK97 gp10 family phage protein
MDSVTIDLVNEKEIEKYLNSISTDALTVKFLNDTLKHIAQVTVLKDARANVPVGTQDTTGRTAHKLGNLKRSLSAWNYPRKYGPGVLVGARSKTTFKKGSSEADGWYAHMIEFGHFAGGKKRKEGTGTYVPPKPFMRPAWEKNKEIFVNMLASATGKAIAKYNKHLKR